MRCFLLALICCLLLVLAGCGGSVSSSPSASGPGSGDKPDDHLDVIQAETTNIYLVMLENAGYQDVVGNPSVPFWNSLASQYALATNYFANTHPSIGNYFMITTGGMVTNDDSFTGTVTSDNFANLLPAAGKSWRVYAESLPQTGYLGPDVFPYLKHHNPFAYFADVISDPSQAANLRSFSSWNADVASGNTANFNLVIPNSLHSAHVCPGSHPCTLNDKLAAADNWMNSNLTPLIASSAFRQHGLLIIAFDEAQNSDRAHGGGHIPVVLVGPSVRRGFRSTTFFQHQSLYRLILDLEDVDTLPASAATAPSMIEFFN